MPIHEQQKKTMRSILTFICLFFFNTLCAQISINIGVDTTTNKSKEVIPFLERYFTDFKSDNQVDYSEYYLEEDFINLESPDKLAFGMLGKTTNYVMGNPHLLALDVKTDTVKAKVLFANIDDSGQLQINFIANYYIQYENGNCRLLNTQKIKTANWQSKKNRNVTFYFPAYEAFNEQQVKSLIDSIVSLEKQWDLQPVNIDYYYASTTQEIQAIKGFDFNFYMARSEYPQGLANEKEMSIYCSGSGANNFHEVVHLYLNPIYPNSPLKEGIATFYGGSLGNDYQTSLVRLNNYIQKYPEINIADHSEFYYLDEQTNPIYAIQAFICHLVYKEKGVNGLKELMQKTSLDEVYRVEFGIEPDKQNEFLRTEISKFVVDFTKRP